MYNKICSCNNKITSYNSETRTERSIMYNGPSKVIYVKFVQSHIKTQVCKYDID